MGETLMSPTPCGVYVSVADLCETVYYTPDADVPREMIDKILVLINQQWSKQSVVDVMLMAECFWKWQYEMTNGGEDHLKTFQFDAITMRIKDDELLPTVVTTGSMGRRETLGFQAVGLEVKDDSSGFKNIDRNKTVTKH